MSKFFDFDEDIDNTRAGKFDIPKKKKETKSKDGKTKTLFNHLNAIYKEEYDPNYFDDMSDADKKSFSIFMINRFLSMHQDWVELVNYAQHLIPFMSRKEVYKFYAASLPDKGRVKFLSYIKSKREKKFDKELIELVSKKYEVSKKEAMEYLEVFSVIDGGMDEIRNICALYGLEEKEIKKLTKFKNG